MGTNIFANIGFSFNKSSTHSVISNITNVKKSVVGLGFVFNQVEQRMNSLDKTTKLIASANAAKDLFSGIKSLGNSVVSVFNKEFDFASSFAATGDKIAKTSRLVGLSAEDYQAFTSAAKHAGMTTEEMDSALKKFSINLGKARSGDKNAFKMFDSILGGKKLSRFKDSVSLISAVADGYQKLGTSQKKAFVSSELFGKSGLKMAELFSKGGAGVKEALADFKSIGGGFNDAGAKNAEIFNDELQKLSETVGSLKIAVAQELFPSFIEIFKIAGKWIRDNKNSLLPKIKQLFLLTTNFAKNMLPKIPIVLDKILSVVDMLGPGVIMIGSAIVPIIPALYQIVMSVKILGATLGGPVLAGIGLCVAAIYFWGKVFKSFYDNWEMFSSFIRNDLKDSFGIIGSILDWLGDGIAEWMYSIYHAFDAWKGWSNFVKNDLKFVFSALDTIGDIVANALFGIYKIFEPLVNLISSIPGKVKNFFGLGDIDVNMNGSSSPQSTLAASAAQAISESHTTVTNRFAVDFNNVPRGTKITPPPKGDFDWSRGYMLGGI